MKHNIREWLSIQRAKNPAKVILMGILLFNVGFLFAASLIIHQLALTGTEHMGLLEAMYYTITMILDAGCVQFVIEDIGRSGVALAIICLIIIVIGMISFTGAVIGYVTNTISNYIDKSNTGSWKLRISNHLVILNWNTRASEIVNDLLYLPGLQKVVILVEGRKAEIEKEIEERLADTISRENRALWESYEGYGFFKRQLLMWKNRCRNNLVVVVQQGDVFSSKQLHDISLEHARSVVILGSDYMSKVCQYEKAGIDDEKSRGNAKTIKTLMQVSDITSAAYSDDDQKIIVEITDDWTYALVQKIIRKKMVAGKCNIVPVRVNQVLGQILAQFSLMPELNLAYKELFSNKGATFNVEERAVADETAYIDEYLKNHHSALPLTAMRIGDKDYFYYSSDRDSDIRKTGKTAENTFSVRLNRDYWIEKKTVIILGHNSGCRDIMEGFRSFCNEWDREDADGSDGQILHIVVIDDRENLEKMHYYEEYPFVLETVEASIYDQDLIRSTIDRIVASNEEDTSVLILSDDTAANENMDASALTNLVYVQDIISEKLEEDPDFDTESIDIIVEIIDPKHHDIVSSYSVDNVVISNRYISKMITQLGIKEGIYEFYTDILTYDDANTALYKSKEVYAKKVSSFFDEIPGECTETELVRAVWEASVDPSLPEERRYPAVVLGYVKPGGQITLFGSDRSEQRVKLEEHDKIIVFTNH
ncbi:MAG: hypothetical protein IKD88_06660 [Lachnospiraceae bacterium]|nr:hypothetical protein [Lachnospiraceae bacterium]